MHFFSYNVFLVQPATLNHSLDLLHFTPHPLPPLRVVPSLPVIYVAVGTLMNCLVTPYNSTPDICSCRWEGYNQEGGAAC